MLSSDSVALIGSPRNEVDLFPRNGIFSWEIRSPGLGRVASLAVDGYGCTLGYFGLQE